MQLPLGFILFFANSVCSSCLPRLICWNHSSALSTVFLLFFPQDSQVRQSTTYSLHQPQGNKEHGTERSGYLHKKSDGYVYKRAFKRSDESLHNKLFLQWRTQRRPWRLEVSLFLHLCLSCVGGLLMSVCQQDCAKTTSTVSCSSLVERWHTCSKRASKIKEVWFAFLKQAVCRSSWIYKFFPHRICKMLKMSITSSQCLLWRSC